MSLDHSKVAILNAVYIIIKKNIIIITITFHCVPFISYVKLLIAQYMVIRVSIVFHVKSFIGSKYASRIVTFHAARVYYLHHLTVVVTCLFFIVIYN